MSDTADVEVASTDVAIAAAEALHGDIIKAGYMSLPEPAKSKLTPFIQAMFEYWSAGKDADPSKVIATYSAAKSTFDSLSGQHDHATHENDLSSQMMNELSAESPTPPTLSGCVSVNAIHEATGATVLVDPLDDSRVIVVEPARLSPHPLSAQLFSRADAASTAALEADVAEHGIDKALVVTGEGCASPPLTVLSGTRRREAALKVGRPVPVIPMDGLSADDEAVLVIRGNLSDTHARKLSEAEKHRAESKLREILGRRKGQRTDLEKPKPGDENKSGTWTATSPGDGRAEKTSETVAKMTGETRNAVEDRAKIFNSTVATDALKEAVDKGAITRTAASALVRAIEMEYRGKLDDATTLQQAKAKLDAQVRQLVANKTDGKKEKKKSATKKKAQTRATGNERTSAPARHPNADKMKSAQQRMEVRQAGIFTAGFFDALECAAEDWMAFAMALQRRIGRDASDRSMRMLPEVQAGRDPRTLPPIMPPALKHILEVHEVISKTLMPIVTGEMRRLMLELLELLGPVQNELAPESIPPGAQVPS